MVKQHISIFPQIAFSWEVLVGLVEEPVVWPFPVGQVAAPIRCYLHDLVTPTLKNIL